MLCPPGGAYGPGRPNPSVLVPGLGVMPLDRSGSRAAVGREGGTTIYEWALEPVGDSLVDLVELRPGMTLGFDVAAVDQDSETDHRRLDLLDPRRPASSPAAAASEGWCWAAPAATSDRWPCGSRTSPGRPWRAPGSSSGRTGSS